jgi:hypothetical protein
MMVGNRGNGQCKRQTTCLPGGDRFDDHGVFRCRYPAVVATAPNTPPNPREACERALKISITSVKNFDSLPLTNNVIRKPGPVQLLLEGDGVANGVSATIGGGIGVSVGDAARRLGASPWATCLPPNCQVVMLEALANSPTGRQTLTLFTPHQFASASVDLYVDLAQGPPLIGDAECNSPAQLSHVRLQLASTRVSPGTTTNGQVFLTLPTPAPAQPVSWTLTLHQSLLQGVSPAIVRSPPANLTAPVAFTFSVAPAPPPQRPPAPGAPVPFVHRTGGTPCVWARLDSSLGTETVAVPVDVTP